MTQGALLFQGAQNTGMFLARDGVEGHQHIARHKEECRQRTGHVDGGGRLIGRALLIAGRCQQPPVNAKVPALTFWISVITL